MDQDTYEKTHVRIGGLTEYDSQDPADRIIGLTDLATAARWNVPVDGTVAGDADDSFRLPANRISVLSENRMVPARELPSFISYEDSVEPYPSDPSTPGDISKVYKKVDGDTVNYYRYVNTAGFTGYVPIANGLSIKDGNCTVVEDGAQGAPARSRAISITAGEPAARPQSGNVIDIRSSELVHCESGAPYFVDHQGSAQLDAGWVNGQNTGFGDEFFVPGVTVDSTGHVTAWSRGGGDEAVRVKIPDTPASSTARGLVMLSDDTPLLPSSTVGGNAGTADPSQWTDGYVRVSRADHRHRTEALSTSGIPTTWGHGSDYDMSWPLRIDFDDMLRAALPAGGPAGEQQVLYSATSSTTAWGSVADALVSADKVTVSGSSVHVGSPRTTLGTLAGLTAGKPYLVRMHMTVEIDSGTGSSVTPAPLPTMCGFSVFLGSGAAEEERHFMVDGSAAIPAGGLTRYVECMVVPAGTSLAVTITADVAAFAVRLNEATAVRIR